jgi:hypothetical protein
MFPGNGWLRAKISILIKKAFLFLQKNIILQKVIVAEMVAYIVRTNI